MIKIKRFKEHHKIDENFGKNIDPLSRVGTGVGKLIHSGGELIKNWKFGKPEDLDKEIKEKHKVLGEKILNVVKSLNDVYGTGDPSINTINMRGENYYFFYTYLDDLSGINSNKTNVYSSNKKPVLYRVDLIKDKDSYYIYLIKDKEDKPLTKNNPYTVRTTSSGRHNKVDYGPSFSGELSKGKTKRDEQNKLHIDDVQIEDAGGYKKNLSRQIFEEAVKKYKKVTKTNTGDIR
jgi:hypothetical protein